MTAPQGSEETAISLVIPVCGDLAKPRLLIENSLPALRRLNRKFEIVLIVDGRFHPALAEVSKLRRELPEIVRAWTLSSTSGEAMSLAAGFKKARGRVIVTTSSQPQAETGEVLKVIEALEDSDVDLVVSRRYPRKDGLMPRLQTYMFHKLMRLLTATRFRDLSCGLRAMKAEVAASLRLYGKFHRYIPVLAESQGFEVVEVDVAHSAKDRPPGIYGIHSYFRRLLDILTVFFLVRFTKRPLRFFGFVGLALFLPGCVLMIYLGAYRLFGFGSIADRPLLLLGVLLFVAGIQIFSVGLLGELIIFTYAREQRGFRIAEVIESSRFAEEAEARSGLETAGETSPD